MRSGVAFVFGFSLLLVHCAGGRAGPGEPTQGSAGSPKLALVTSSASSWWKLVTGGVRKYEREGHVRVDVRMPEESRADHQEAILRELASAQFDAVAVDLVDPKAQTPMLRDLAARMHLVTFINDAPESGRVLYVGTDHYAAGKVLGTELSRRLPNGGIIAIFVGVTTHPDVEDRIRGIREVVGASAIKIIGVYEDHVDRTRAQTNVEETLRRTPELAAVVGLWSYNGPAIAAALRATGARGKVRAVVSDEEDGTLDAIEDGTIDVTVVQRPEMFGYVASKCMHVLVTDGNDPLCVRKGESPYVDTGVEAIDAKNIGDFRQRLEVVKH